MVHAIDVAEFVLCKTGSLSAMKLQKLMYYAQAWHLAWKDEPLFVETIEAWINGPVVRDLYARHSGEFNVAPGYFGGDFNALDSDSKDVVEKVLGFYGDKSSQWLSDLTHSELPWLDARHGLPPNVRGHNPITLASMTKYYRSL